MEPVQVLRRPRRSIADQYRDGTLNAWLPNREHAAALAARSRAPSMLISGHRLMDVEPKEVFLPAYLSAAGREKWGKDYRTRSQYQNRGTCVGQSHKMMADLTMAIWRFVGGGKFPGRAAVGPIYAGSRVEVGGEPGPWDGSNGSWAAEWLQKWGVVLLKELDLPEDELNRDESYAVQWASRRDGVPASYETAARVRPIKQTPAVSTVEEVRAALSNLMAVNICTDLIPSSRRNSNGVAQVSRGGGHSTGIVGQRKIGGEWVYAYLQSWGDDWASGPYGWPKFDPTGEYAGRIVDITEQALASILRSRDCYAFAGPQGLEPIDSEYFL